MKSPVFNPILAASACAMATVICAGCATTLNDNQEVIVNSEIPRELQKVTHPTYRVAAPDILLVEAVHNIRPAGDQLRAGDVINIKLGNPAISPLDPKAGQVERDLWARRELAKFIDGDLAVQADGTINLGPTYGSVKVEDLTVPQAQAAIRKHLTQYIKNKDGTTAGIKNPEVSVTMPNVSGKQVISGQHLVRPDGTVSLGVYGAVDVAGMTVAEVKAAIEKHLTRFINKPEVNVDVLAYNSQVYYVITDGGGFGEQVIRLPCTGNETVLDAISNIQGLSQVSSKRIWVARPAPAGATCAQVMDVNWGQITREGVTTTNYQILPGDRVYIAADHMIAFDNFIAKVTAPLERILGFTLLGHGTVRAIQFGHRNNQGNNAGGGGGFGF